jgi:pyrimidine-nucleoside phosphorylase
MLMTDLIAKKRDGGALEKDEIQFMIDGYVGGTVPDYQMSAMCMAILFRGMDSRETLDLTMAMMNSGEKIDLGAIDGVKADKHSTAAWRQDLAGALPHGGLLRHKDSKNVRQGTGHTGGTIDKLESFQAIPPLFPRKNS